MFQEINELTVIVINLFDLIETMYTECNHKGTMNHVRLDMSELIKYRYIIGFLMKLRSTKEQYEDKQTKLMSIFKNWSNTQENFDNSLQTLKLYYHRRYVEGIVDEENQQDDEEEDIDAIEENLEEDDDKNNNERKPILICDNILMSNYFIKGVEDAIEIEQFDEIEECKNIKNSCCEKEDLEEAFKRFNHTVIPYVTKKYRVLNDILNFVVSNYSVFVNYAYHIYKIKTVNPVCRLASKNLIFTPINKNFITKFQNSMNKAHKFAINSKNGLMCSLCDYDFHKLLIEE